ncbi:magnesium transporter CorA family protein [Promicromonospora sukumoe]
MEVRLITAHGVASRTVDELPALLAADEGLLWVDVPECDDDAARVLTEVFRFHPLAVKDAVERNRVPKMHAYRDHVFVVLHGPERGEHGHVHYIELDQFVGRRFLVTVHGPVNPAVDDGVALRETRAVLERIKADRFRPDSGFELSRAIVSAMARVQDEFVETVTSDVWRFEQWLTGGRVTNPEGFLDGLFRARHELLAVWTMSTQNSAVYDSLAGLRGVSWTGRAAVADGRRLFDLVRDLTSGQLQYVHGLIEYYRSVLDLTSTMVGQRQNDEVRKLAEATYRQSETVKKISAWAAIFLAPTLIGTIYGMNFEHMPELSWPLGYPVAVLVMAGWAVWLYVGFKKRRWL